MSRIVKKVPLDFDYKGVWYGNLLKRFKTCHTKEQEYCEQCIAFARIKGIPFTTYECPDYEGYFGEVMEMLNNLCSVPEGEGYQLWEETSEGSPMSPVFETLEELGKWCEENATVVANRTLRLEEWMNLFTSQLRDSNSKRFVTLTDGTGMGGELLVFKTDAPVCELQELEKVSCDLTKDGKDAPIWTDVLAEKGYSFEYVDSHQHVTAFGTSSSWLEDHDVYKEIKEHYVIEY